MASFGAKNPYFAPIESEPEGALPVYKGEPVKIGRLVKADLTLTMASGKLYADDELAESAEEFVSGSIAMETDDILDAVASVIYGARRTPPQLRKSAWTSPTPERLPPSRTPPYAASPRCWRWRR